MEDWKLTTPEKGFWSLMVRNCHFRVQHFDKIMIKTNHLKLKMHLNSRVVDKVENTTQKFNMQIKMGWFYAIIIVLS